MKSTSVAVALVLLLAPCYLSLHAAEPAAVAELHEAIQPVPRGGWWMKRHQSMNDRVAKGNVDLIFIGDSITQAWEGAGKAAWQKHYDKRNAVNLGISGDRTQHVLWRLDNGNIKNISPKLAVIMIGTNNSTRNPSEQTIEGIELIVEKLRTKLPTTKILLLAVFPRGADSKDPARLENDKVNAAIAKLDDGESVFFLDIADAFLDEKGNLSKEIMPDLLHLNEASYQMWADAIESNVARLMGE